MKKYLIPLTILFLSLFLLACEEGDDGTNLSSYFSHDSVGLLYQSDTLYLVPPGYDFDSLAYPSETVEFEFPSTAVDGTFSIGENVGELVLNVETDEQDYYAISGTVTFSDSLKRIDLTDVVLNDEDDVQADTLSGYFSLSEIFEFDPPQAQAE